MLSLAGCAADEAVPAPTDAAPTEAPTPALLPIDAPSDLAAAVGKPVSLEARDLVLRLDGAEIHVPYLSGELVAVEGGQVVDLDAPRSFEVTIRAIELRIPDQTLGSALGARAGKKGPFKDLAVRTEGDSMFLDGHLSTLGLPFSFHATPKVVRGGALALELEKVRVLGIGVKGFLRAFEKPIEKAANKRGHLVEVDEDWLVIDPFPFAGPPAIHAAFTSVDVRAHDIVARLGEIPPSEERKEPAGVVLSGGVFRNKKTLFFNATLRLLAQDGGALVIDPDTFGEQILGGTVKTTENGDPVVYVLAPGEKPIQPVETPPSGPEEPKTPVETR